MGAAPDEVREHPAGPGTDPETVPAHPRPEEEPPRGRCFAEVGHRVRGDVDHPRPRLGHPGLGEPRRLHRQAGGDAPEHGLGRRRVQHPRPLERGDLVRGPAPSPPPASRKSPRRTDEDPEAPRARSEEGPELREVTERARSDVVLDEVADRDRVPPVRPAPEAEPGGIHRGALPSAYRIGSSHRRADRELRQIDAEVRGEERAPRPAREHHRLRAYPPALGMDRGDPSRLRLHRTHRAALDDAHAEPAGRAGERRHRDEGLGPAIARGEDAARPPSGEIRDQRPDLLRGEEA